MRMHTPSTPIPCLQRARRGLSLVEAMISLTITSMLLGAMAAAFSASGAAVENNDAFFRSTSAARISILQVMSEVRRCQALTAFSDHLDMITADNCDRTYKFISSPDGNGQLVLIDNASPDPTTAQHTLASGIASLTFASDTKTVTMTLTTQAGANQVTLSGAAMQRRLLTYPGQP